MFIYIADIKKYKYLNYKVQNNYLLLIIKYQNAIFITFPLRPGIHSSSHSLNGIFLNNSFYIITKILRKFAINVPDNAH